MKKTGVKLSKCDQKPVFILTSELSSESVLGKGWISLNHICKFISKMTIKLISLRF